MTTPSEEHLSDLLQERSVDAVVLHQDESGHVRPATGGVPVDLTDATALSEDAVAELQDSSVRLTAPDHVPAEVVDTLAETLVPPAFRASPWFREHRALVFRDGRCQVGPLEFRYTEEFGVYLDEGA